MWPLCQDGNTIILLLLLHFPFVKNRRHFWLDLIGRGPFSFFTSQHVTEIYKKEINKSLSFHDLPYSNFCIFFILLVIEREGMREAWIFEKICLFSLNLINVIVPSFRNALRGNICLHLKLHKKQYSFSLVKSITLWAFRSWQAILHALKKSWNCRIII